METAHAEIALADGQGLQFRPDEHGMQETVLVPKSGYAQRAAPEAQVHRSSVLRALQRTGYVFKKNARGRRSKTVR